jgi:hypothetical protein
MGTVVTVINTSSSHGGVVSAHKVTVIIPDGPSNDLGTIESGQQKSVDLSKLGWDKYVGKSFRIRAMDYNHTIHSAYCPYTLDTHYTFEVHGPTGQATITGPR